MIETEDHMIADDQNEPNADPAGDSESQCEEHDNLCGENPADAENDTGEPSSVEDGAQSEAATERGDSRPASAPEPEDERLRQLEEIDRDVRESGPIGIVGELEYVPVPKRRRGAPKDEDAGDLELTSVGEARGVLEAFLFTTNEPVSVARLSKLMNNLHPRTVRGLLMELQSEYDERGGSLQIVEVAGGFQMATRPDYADWVFRLHKHRRRNPLTAATLETLAIIAYKQPVTKAEIETIRGVESSATLRTLIDHGLVEISGRREVLGRPQLYATTELFLKTFGLRSIADLPPITELKSLFAEDQKLKRTAASSTPGEALLEQDEEPECGDSEEEGTAECPPEEADPSESEEEIRSGLPEDADSDEEPEACDREAGQID